MIGALSESVGLSITLTLTATITLVLTASNLVRRDNVRRLR